MNTRPLVVITTRLPPQVCGIGTYSWLLHQHWPGDVSSAQFLVVDGAIESVAELDFSNVAEFNANGPNFRARSIASEPPICFCIMLDAPIIATVVRFACRRF